MVAEIDRARKANESLGGVFEVRAFGLVPGIGSHISWEERLDGRLAGAVMSIQAMKGVGIGDGFELAERDGSQAHDEIFFTKERGFFRETNRAGGLEGGMTTGDPLVLRAAMKPLPTLTKPLRRGDLAPRSRLRPCASARLVHSPPAAWWRGDGGPRLAAGYRGSSAATPRYVRSALSASTERIDGLGHRLRARPRASWSPQVDRARALAASGSELRDSDRELELALGEPIEGFFDRQGEEAFREREEEIVCELLARGDAPVIALGGGAEQSERVREALGRHTVVHLEVDPESAWRRASGGGRPRPATGPASRSCTATEWPSTSRWPTV